MYDPFVCQSCYRGTEGDEPFTCFRCKVGERSKPFICQRCEDETTTQTGSDNLNHTKCITSSAFNPFVEQPSSPSPAGSSATEGWKTMQIVTIRFES